MEDNVRTIDLDIVVVRETIHNCRNVRSKELFKFPIADVTGRYEHSFQDPFRGRKLSTKSESFVITTHCSAMEMAFISASEVRLLCKVKRVDGVIPCYPESRNQPSRKLRVDEKLHATAGSIRLIRVTRAAYAKAARMSSRSRSS